MKKKCLCLTLCFLLALSMLLGCSQNISGSASGTSEAPGNSAPSSAPNASSDTYSTTLADILAKGELIIGLDDTFAPMGFRDTDGTLVGFDIDLSTAVCEKLGVTPIFQPVDWNSKEMELSTGNIDCIWNGLSATPERQVIMSLSQNYLNNKIIVMANNGVTLESKKDLANFNIGIQASSAALEAVMADPDYELFKDNITEYPTYDEVILAMISGREDCMVIDEVFGNYKNTQLENSLDTAPFDFGDDLYAVGFRKGDTELTEAVNAALNELIAEGVAAEISIKWFGEDIVIQN